MHSCRWNSYFFFIFRERASDIFRYDFCFNDGVRQFHRAHRHTGIDTQLSVARCQFNFFMCQMVQNYLLVQMCYSYFIVMLWSYHKFLFKSSEYFFFSFFFYFFILQHTFFSHFAHSLYSMPHHVRSHHFILLHDDEGDEGNSVQDTL